MTSTSELTSTYVIAAGAAATTHAAGDAFWRRLAERSPDLSPADGRWLVSWHTARVSTRVQLLHITSGAGTAFKRVQGLGE
jgi:hypothetical protein